LDSCSELITFSNSGSLFHASSEPARVQNYIGPAGAHAAALCFELLGLTAFLLPVFVVAAGWRLLRRRGSERSPLRVVGALVVLATLPALLQATVGPIPWRGGPFESGGAFGQMLAGALLERMALPGTLLVLTSAVVLGTALAVQSTLGEVARAWAGRVRDAWERYRLARERRAERRSKERSRRRVVAKHLQRVMAEKDGEEGAPVGSGDLDLPLRVTERKGEGGFAVRKVSGAEVMAERRAAERAEERSAGTSATGDGPSEPRGAKAARRARAASEDEVQSEFLFVDEA
jgi:DNA segregation ATPase FtsK/SpoIIIE-like protein